MDNRRLSVIRSPGRSPARAPLGPQIGTARSGATAAAATTSTTTMTSTTTSSTSSNNLASPTVSSSTRPVRPSALPPTPPGSPKTRAREGNASPPPDKGLQHRRREKQAGGRESRWEGDWEPERGRTRYRSCDLNGDTAFSTRYNYSASSSSSRRGRSSSTGGGGSSGGSSNRTDATRVSSPWVTPVTPYALPPHEPSYPSPPPTPGCVVSTSGSYLAAAFSAAQLLQLRLQQNHHDPDHHLHHCHHDSNHSDHSHSHHRQHDPSEPPSIARLQDAMKWYLAASAGLYFASQLGLGVVGEGSAGILELCGRGCLGAAAIAAAQTAFLAAWGWGHLGRGVARRGDGQPQRTWRRRWARLEVGLGCVFAAVAGLTGTGLLLVALALWWGGRI